MWVYTEYGQRIGELHGVRRPAGKPAMCGYKPVDGVTAQTWKERGYIEWKEDEKDDAESAHD